MRAGPGLALASGLVLGAALSGGRHHGGHGRHHGGHGGHHGGFLGGNHHGGRRHH